MRLLVTAYDQNNMPAGSQIIEAGQPVSFHVPSPYLVSAGQDIVLGVSVFDVDFMVRTFQPLLDARELLDIQVTRGWNMSLIPSIRPLWQILAEAVQHGVDYPTHGVDCACMDDFVREMRQHISRAIPPDTRPLDEVHTQAEIHERLMAKNRIHHVLHMLGRSW